jgi:hypothetical protein
MPGTSDLAAATDADLVRRAAEGDKDAFGAIFERYHGVVYRFARTMTGAADRAEDVTQEVFVVLLRDLARYEPHRAMLSTYLYEEREPRSIQTRPAAAGRLVERLGRNDRAGRSVCQRGFNGSRRWRWSPSAIAKRSCCAPGRGSGFRCEKGETCNPNSSICGVSSLAATPT